MLEDRSISLNKYISQTGICSRREADTIIEQGRVLLQGKIAKKGNRVNPGDTVLLDGKKIKSKNNDVFIVLNKPPGVVSTTDSQEPNNIINFIGHKRRIFPIGRLDKDSEGLILLTNNGDIVNKILRSKNNHEKEYIVTVDKAITPDFISKMSLGVPILGTITKKCEVEQLNKTMLRIILTEGLNRQIRRMCKYFGYKVKRLKRIRIMHIHLANLPLGHWRNLSNEEVSDLFSAIRHD